MKSFYKASIILFWSVNTHAFVFITYDLDYSLAKVAKKYIESSIGIPSEFIEIKKNKLPCQDLVTSHEHYLHFCIKDKKIKKINFDYFVTKKVFKEFIGNKDD